MVATPSGASEGGAQCSCECHESEYKGPKKVQQDNAKKPSATEKRMLCSSLT